MFEEGHYHYEKLQKSKNVLLVKDDVGRPKACVRYLPPGNHAYGYKAKPDAEGAGSLLTSWNVHKPSMPAKPGKDFQKLNRPVKRREEAKPKLGGSARMQEQYGIKNKPSTPIDQVISNEFGNLATLEKHEVYQCINSRNPESIQKAPNEPKTKSPQAAKEENKGMFKLKKFSKVGPRVLVTSKKTS